MLPGLYLHTLKSIDPSTLHAVRLETVSALSKEAAHAAAITALMSDRLGRECDELGVEVQVLVLGRESEAIALEAAASTGTITHLGRLRRTATWAKAAGINLTLRGAVGSRVARGTPLLTADKPAGRALLTRQLIKITPAEEDRYLLFAEALHEEALEAIQSAGASWLLSVLDTYRELIVAPSAEVARIGFAPDVATTARALVFARSPVEHISSNLYEEMRVAALANNREVAIDVLTFPKLVARRSSILGSLHIVYNMSRLYPELYLTLTQNPSAPLQDLLRDRTWRLLVELIDVPASADVTNSQTPEALDKGMDILAIVDIQLVELLRHAVDAADEATIDSALRRWPLSLSHWEPEHAHPNSADVERMRLHDASNPALTSMEAQADNNAYAARAKDDLNRRRSAFIVGLAMWSLRVCRQSQAAADQRGVFDRVTREINSSEDLLLAVGDALSGVNHFPFSRWVSFASPELIVHVGGADSELLATLVVLLAGRLERGESADVPPADWLVHRIGQLDGILDQLESEHGLLRGLGVTDPGAALAEVRKRLHGSVELQQSIEDDRVRSIHISAEVKAKVTQTVTEAWDQSRFLRPIAEALGAQVQPRGDAAAYESHGRAGGLWVPKQFLNDDEDVGTFVERLGRGLSLGEVAALDTAFDGSPIVSATIESVGEVIRGQVESLSKAGFQANALLAPRDWRIRESLGLQIPFGSISSDNAVELPAQSVGRYIGEVDGLSYYSCSELRQRLLLLDVRSLVWSWPEGNDDPFISVTVEEFEHDEALEIAQRTASSEEEGEERAGKMTRQVYLSALEPFMISLADVGAGRVISLSSEQGDLTA